MKKINVKKEKSQQILATLVMGMNLVNSMTPMALVMDKTIGNTNLLMESVPKSEAEPLEYTVLPQILNAVDNMIFGKVEAGDDYHVSSGQISSVGLLSPGHNMYVYSGGTGTVSTMNGGRQTVSSGGTGTVSTLNYGSQYVSSGGTGTVSTMNRNGRQYVYSGGTGTVSTMNSKGVQYVSSGGTGTVSTMNSNGWQYVYSGGTGTVSTMNRGEQYVHSGGTGTVSTMNDGRQIVSSGATGTVSTLNDGVQLVYSGATGTVSTINRGVQYVYSGGTGTVSTMNNGGQTVSSGGTGTVSTMNGNGWQYVYSGGTGTVSTMNGGRQTVSSGGTGTVSTMNRNGWQYVYSGGTGTVSTLNGGSQTVYSGGTGTVSTMNGGRQTVSSGGTGTVSTMNNGEQLVYSGGTGTVSTMNDGSQYVSSGGTGTVSTMNGGSQYVYNGGISADTTLYGGTQIIYSGGTGNNTTIYGGTAGMSNSSAVVNDLTMTGGTYLLGGDRGNYNVGGRFCFAGGDFDMTRSISYTRTETYETLTIEKLEQGGGTFIMDTDLSSETNGDKILIDNAVAGTSYIQVNDASFINGVVQGHKNLLLVTVNNGTAAFAGKDLNNGGVWTVTPTIENGVNVTDAAGNVIGTADQWYLTHVVRSVNNDTQVLLDGSDSSYALWRNTNDTLRKRLGDLRYRSNKMDGDGIWAHYLSGKFNGTSFDGSYNMYQLGYDKADNSKSTYGIAVESGTGRGDYNFGSSKDKLWNGSLYGTWYGDNGSYTDVVARIGQMDTDIKSYGDYPDKATAKSHVYSLSVEYGKTIELSKKAGTFIEPQAQFIIGRLGSSSYTTDRGNNVYLSGVNSYIGRIGFTAGQKTPDGNDVYFKASLMHEFGGSRDIHLKAANGETMSVSREYRDSWFEVGFGTNIHLSKASYFYGDIERSFGGDIEKKWQINAGVRFEF